MELLDGLIIFLVVLIVGMGGYMIYVTLPGGQAVYYQDFESEAHARLPSTSYQFYPNMRFEDRRVSYSIDPSCSQSKENSILSALDILSERTPLVFYPATQSNIPEIDFLCYSVTLRAENKNHFVAGEGGPTEIINVSAYYVIESSQVSLYRSERCTQPQIALHEILHALGFDHNNNTQSVLYPVTNCDQVLDEYIVSELRRLYSIESAPDLVLERVSANKTGRYLNFEVWIANYGLADSKNSTLQLYVDSTYTKSFNVAELDLGKRKYLTVSNVRVPSSAQELTFVLETTNGERELTNVNNRADLTLS